MSQTETVNFRLVRFNPRRAARGVGAAEVEVSDDTGSMLLWMTKKDIANNIRDFGNHQGLIDAQEAYKAGVDYPPKEE